MSHFTVLVIGDHIEEQLQPYHEYECTGIEDQYVEFIAEMSKEDMEKAFKKYNKENPEKQYDTAKQYAREYEGYIRRGNEYGRRTNPNSRWDWWQVGGRWSGMLKLKNGERVDSACKSEIDFEGMIQDTKDERKEHYRTVMSYFPDGIPKFRLWKDILDDESFEDQGKRRTFYHNQEALKIWNKIKDKGFLESLEEFLIDEEEYVGKGQYEGFSTYAVIDEEGLWIGQGDMGWFGISSETDEEKKSWEETFYDRFIKHLEDDVLLTIVDCHV